MLFVQLQMKTHIERQTTVALPNQPGQLAAICRLLSSHSINIEALSLVDSIEQGVVRLLTSDPQTCRKVLQANGFYVIEGEVLVIDLFDRIGKLAQISAALAEAKVNIDYVYGSVEHPGAPMRLVLKASDGTRARAILAEFEDGI
jgi:hypothetical protein